MTETPGQEEGAHDAPSTQRPDPDRGGYLGFVAHEVRNPLSTAIWTAELLARMSGEERGGARGEKLSGMCLRSLARVRQLIEDHFLCERLDAGGLPIRAEELQLKEALDAVLARPPPDIGPVTIEGDATLRIEADRALLERAIDALVANAGRGGTPVRVKIAAGTEQFTIVVAGDAPPAGALEDPKKGAPSDQKGRALGLAMARRVAVALGGALSVADGAYVLSLPGHPTYTAREEF